MSKVRSLDGTMIAFDRLGSGPAVILVDGALCYRKFGPMKSVAKLLAQSFTVFNYDRRGRGESGDTAPYAVEREIEDIAALLHEAGGSAFLFGTSSGAALALEAAAHLPGIRKLALYEAPFVVDDSHPPRPEDYLARMSALIAEGRRGDTLKMFMKTVGAPSIAVFAMRFTPMWPKLKAVAHTLPYDFAILGDTGRGNPLPAGRWVSVTMPVLVGVGGKSPAWMKTGMGALTALLAHAQLCTLPGQTHMVKPRILAPMLAEFFLQ